MRIVCPQCGSEYAFQDDRLPGHGAKVKCSTCEHVFTVDPRSSSETSDAPKVRKMAKLGRKAIYLRQEGKVYSVRDLALLQRWVVEKRVLATDEVSTDAETWEVAYRVAQLRPFFAVLRQLRETKRELQLTRESLRVYETRELMMAQSGITGSEPVFPEGRLSGSSEVSQDLPGIRDTREVMADMARAAEQDAAMPAQPRVVLSRGLESLDDEDFIGQGLGAGEEVDPAAMTQQVFPGPPGLDGLDPAYAIADMLAGDTVTARRDADAPYATGERDDHPMGSAHESQEIDSWFQEPDSDDDRFGSPDDLVEPESLHDRLIGASGSLDQDDDGESDGDHEPVTREQELPGQESAVDPIPEGARELMSRAISVDHIEPVDTPSAQSVVLDGPAQAAAADRPSPPNVSAETVRETAAAAGEPAATGVAAGPLTSEESLGREFERFDESYEDSAAPSPVEQWERDDFQDGGAEAERAGGGSNLWIIVGGVVLVTAIVVGAVLVVHYMRQQTKDLVGDVATTADQGDPTEADGAAGETSTGQTGQPDTDGAAIDGADATPDEETATEEPTPEEPTPDADATTDRGTDRDADPIETLLGVDDTEPPTPSVVVEPPTPAPPVDGGDVVRARELARAGNHGGAIAEFNKVVASNPASAEGHKGLGWSYIELGNNSRAAEHFRKAVNLDAMDPENHYGLGLSYEGLGDNDRAINEYQTYIGLAPDGREAAEVRILLRRLLEMQGEAPG